MSLGTEHEANSIQGAGKNKKNETLKNRIPYAILIVIGLIWVFTIPIRNRMNRETATIESETQKQTDIQKQRLKLSSNEEEQRKKIAANPKDFDALMALASALSQQRKYPEALANLKTAQSVRPDSALPHAAMGQLFDASNLHDLSIDELREAIRLDPKDAVSQAMLGYQYVSAGWNLEAENLLIKALAAKPDDVRLHVTLALVKFQNNHTADAEKELLIARKLAPSETTVIGPLIEVYRNSQRYEEALKVIDEAMKTFPNKRVLITERARIYLAMQKPSDAIIAANEAIKMDQGQMDAVYIRAVCYKMQGKTDEAIKDFEAIQSIDPRVEQTLLLLGQLYLQKGKAELGKQLLSDYDRNMKVGQELSRLTLRVASQPNDWKSHLEMGTYYAKGGSYGRAIVEMKKVLELKPDKKEALEVLAISLKAIHRDKEAEAYRSMLPVK